LLDDGCEPRLFSLRLSPLGNGHLEQSCVFDISG
jgi:hypothetical protein